MDQDELDFEAVVKALEAAGTELENAPPVVSPEQLAEKVREAGRKLKQAAAELRMVSRKEARVPELSGSPKHATSDQAPGEDVIQVNDQYAGGKTPLEDSEHDQHQTGG
jgi:hypothetical protein